MASRVTKRFLFSRDDRSMDLKMVHKCWISSWKIGKQVWVDISRSIGWRRGYLKDLSVIPLTGPVVNILMWLVSISLQFTTQSCLGLSWCRYPRKGPMCCEEIWNINSSANRILMNGISAIITRFLGPALWNGRPFACWLLGLASCLLTSFCCILQRRVLSKTRAVCYTVYFPIRLFNSLGQHPYTDVHWVLFAIHIICRGVTPSTLQGWCVRTIHT